MNAVPADSEYTLQAQYLLGVILTKEAMPAAPAAPATPDAAAGPTAPTPPAATPAPRPRYGTAIEQFRKVTRMPATDAGAPPRRRSRVDGDRSALLRDRKRISEAAEAYSHVDRHSPEFSTMLHELAWVYVRLGDYQRAQRALEVLAITDPNNLDIADGSLLRADLLLALG